MHPILLLLQRDHVGASSGGSVFKGSLATLFKAHIHYKTLFHETRFTRLVSLYFMEKQLFETNFKMFHEVESFRSYSHCVSLLSYASVETHVTSR